MLKWRKAVYKKSTNLLGIIQRSDKDTAELSEILKFLLGIHFL